MNKAKNLTSTNLDSYLHSLYTASITKESFSAFSAKAYSIMSNLPKDYVSLDSTQKYTTLSSLVKSNTIDIENLHYIVDNSILKDAQEHPENYQSLSVRISGWNARFVTLDKEWQDMVIEKTSHGSM